MFQNSYTGIQPLQRNQTYRGGFCQFWYLPVEGIGVFPRINAANQFLVAEPSLVPGYSWFGPIEVPRNKLGFTESFQKTKAGPYYQTKMEGIHIGDSPASRVNLENMPYHKYLVVGKVRAGGFYMIIGTVDSPCSFDPDYSSGNGPGETAQTKFTFASELINKALVLPSFGAATQAPADGGTGNTGGNNNGGCMSQKEIIPFVNQSTIQIPWTPDRLAKFNTFPIVEVWIQEPGQQPYLNIGGSIEVDAPPPQFTELSVKLGGSPSGFIVIT